MFILNDKVEDLVYGLGTVTQILDNNKIEVTFDNGSKFVYSQEGYNLNFKQFNKITLFFEGQLSDVELPTIQYEPSRLSLLSEGELIYITEPFDIPSPPPTLNERVTQLESEINTKVDIEQGKNLVEDSKILNYDNHISSIDNPHEVTASQVGAYTKTEVDDLIANVDVDLTNYYTKSEIDTSLSNKVNNSQLESYYTKTETDQLIANIDVDLTNYYTKSETYSKTEVDTIINDIDVDLTNYYNITETNTLLNTKVDKVEGKGLSTNDLTNDLKSEIESVKVVNVTTDAVNHKLVIEYSNDTVLNLDFNDIVTDVYVEGATLDANTNILTLKSSSGGADVEVDLSHFVNNSQLSSYYNKTEVDTLLSNIDVDLTDYYTKTESDNKFVAKTSSSLNRLAKFSDTTGNITDSNLISSPAGDLGLNVFPSLWSNSVRALETDGGAFFNLNNNSVKMIQNGYYSVGNYYVYKKTGVASLYSQENGEHIWSSAPSGTAETSLTFTEKMKLDSSGNLYLNGNQVVTSEFIITNIEDSLNSTSTTKSLSANQGKVLNDTKVDKVEGKGLSTNDLTNDLKSEIESVKVADISIDGPNKDIIVHYTDDSTNALSLDDIVSQTEIDKKIQIETIMLTDTLSSFTEIYGTNSVHDETVYHNQHDVFEDNSCYATYLFNGNANDLGGLYNGVATNVTYVPGAHDEAASFNGTNSKIDITNIILPDTIVATFYLKVNAFKDQMFLDFGDGRCVFMYSTQDRRLRAQYANVNNANTSSTNVLELGVTYFVVATITKTSATLNIDKVDQTRTAWANYINSRGKSIGYRNDNTLFSNCTIDQLKIFNRTLTPTEIEFLYVGTFGSYQVSKIQIDNGVFMYAKGLLGEVYTKEYQEFTGTTGIGTLADGWYYVAKDENNVFSFHTDKPTIGKTGSSVYFMNGQLYNASDVLISPAISYLKDKIRISNGLIVEVADALIPRTVSTNSVNTDLSGLSTLSYPKLNVEVLTEFRHPVTNKPIYMKVFDFGTLPNTTTKSLAHGLTNIDFVQVDYNQSYVYVTGNTTRYPVVWASTTTASQWNCDADNTNIIMQTGSDRTTYRAYVVLKYTKTTDTENSPTRLVGNLDYISSPNGTKYKIVVDNSGALSTILA